MRLSIYTFVKDGLYFDFHVVDMLRHHLPLADEIVVNEGYSSDGTYEAIRDIDPKIRVVRNEWDRSDPKTWSMKFKNQARSLCTGDWCILLDCDEFIPEWEFDRIRDHLQRTDKSIVPMRYLHFYGNYKVRHTSPKKVGWPAVKSTMHRNSPEFEIWGDGSNVRSRSDDRPELYDDPLCDCHHFGFVRNPARLRQKWRIQRKRNQHDPADKPSWDRTPGFVFDLMPHRWDDPDFLPDVAQYDGPYVRAVRENPDEFIRDDEMLCRLLESNGQPRAAVEKMDA